MSVMYSVWHLQRDGSLTEGTHRYDTHKSAATVAANVNDTREQQLRSGIVWPSTLSFADVASDSNPED